MSRAFRSLNGGKPRRSKDRVSIEKAAMRKIWQEARERAKRSRAASLSVRCRVPWSWAARGVDIQRPWACAIAVANGPRPRLMLIVLVRARELIIEARPPNDYPVKRVVVANARPPATLIANAIAREECSALPRGFCFVMVRMDLFSGRSDQPR